MGGQHLQVFRKQLFVQREALDDSLVTGVESPQLQPLAGRVSVGATRREKLFKARVCVTAILTTGWGQMPGLHGSAPSAPPRRVNGEDDTGEGMQSAKSKNKSLRRR